MKSEKLYILCIKQKNMLKSIYQYNEFKKNVKNIYNNKMNSIKL